MFLKVSCSKEGPGGREGLSECMAWKNVFPVSPFFSFFFILSSLSLPWVEELSSIWPFYCCASVLEPTGHGLNFLKTVNQNTLSSFKLLVSCIFVHTMRKWLIYCVYTHVISLCHSLILCHSTCLTYLTLAPHTSCISSHISSRIWKEKYNEIFWETDYIHIILLQYSYNCPIYY